MSYLKLINYFLNLTWIKKKQLYQLQIPKGANKVQALGGVNTYLKRYLYMNALEIVENDMFDGMKEKTPKQPKVEKPTQEIRYIGSEEKNQLREKLGGSEFAKVLNACGGKLTYEKFEELMQ